ncbi:MAG: hypothetical protein AB8B64_24590 [Granulosicoccus sp.]
MHFHTDANNAVRARLDTRIIKSDDEVGIGYECNAAAVRPVVDRTGVTGLATGCPKTMFYVSIGADSGLKMNQPEVLEGAFRLF